MKRVLCVRLPDFPIQRLHCERPEHRAVPLVLYQESGNRAQVVLSSAEARRQGIRSGMPLAEAQALLESAVFVPHDHEADLLQLQTLARLCHRYSPVVGLELRHRTHCLVLDITGCTHLFGDESDLIREVVSDLGNQGYFSHTAVANTIGAAWAVARYGHRATPDRRLRSLPVEALRIPDELVSRLHQFDLRTVGGISALPRDTLPSRFGTVLNKRLDQMFGRCAEMIVPVPRSEPVSTQWVTDEPICHPEAFLHICDELLAEILSVVTARSEGLLRLTLNLESEAAAPVCFEIGLTRPADSAAHVMELLRLKLETEPVPEWLVAVHMEASVTAPLNRRQRGLFDHDKPDDGSDVRRLIDRLDTRLGPDAVVRPKLLPEAVPEQAVGYVPLTKSVPEPQPQPLDVALPTASSRPLELLLKPKPIDVMSVVPDGPPVRLYWNRRQQRIAHCTGFERISTGRWSDGRDVDRVYYLVETENGARLWLFRNEHRDWFLHGVFE